MSPPFLSSMKTREMKRTTLISPRGCVTPKLIGNLNEAIDEEGGDGEEKDYSVIDGYEDLSDELQEKIRGALEQGHVDDEDWKGVCTFLYTLLYISREVMC